MHSGAARKTALPIIGGELLGKLGKCMRSARWEGMGPIVVRGEILRDVYFVALGRVEARYKLSRLGPQSLILTPGDFFGERAVLEDDASDAAVRPLEPGVVIGAVALEDFKAVLDAEPALKTAFVECVAARRSLLRAMAQAREAAAGESSPSA